jgi:DNA-binding GntR family transcriptional regulator
MAPEPVLRGGGPPRVLKAFEQVHAHLRNLIMRGELARGQRLPNEVTLAAHFGVSRGTVREALRLLVADGLVRTAKGAGGGSYVTLPTVGHLSEFMERNIELLSAVADVTLPEFLEARELIEVYAARRAAERRTNADLERLRETLATDGSPYELYLKNKAFHDVLIDVCGNGLLRISPSRSSPSCTPTSPARRSRTRSRARCAPTTRASSRASRPVTPRPPPAPCAATSTTSAASTAASGSGPSPVMTATCSWKRPIVRPPRGSLPQGRSLADGRLRSRRTLRVCRRCRALEERSSPANARRRPPR